MYSSASTNKPEPLSFKHLVYVLLLFTLTSPSFGGHWDCRGLLQIGKNRALIRESGETTMNVKRRLKEYSEVFGPLLQNTLSLAHKADFYWLDLGAGNAFAQRDALLKEGFKNLHTLAIGYNPPGDFNYGSDLYSISEKYGKKHFQYFSGHFFHDLPLESYNNKVDLVTDYYGVLSYTDNFSRDLHLALQKLKVGGKLMMLLANPKKSLHIRKEDSSLVTVNDFFSKLLGAKVKELEPIHGGQLRLILERTESNLSVPDLQILSLISSTPPERKFLLTGNTIGVPPSLFPKSVRSH